VRTHGWTRTVNDLAKTVELACSDCHRIITVSSGNLGWCLKSDEEVKGKSKKDVVNFSFSKKNGREPSDVEHKAHAKELKDDIVRVKPKNPECPVCPGSHLSSDWQGYVVVLNPSRSEIASILNIDRAGNYALKVNMR
jgi:DNA-directed RNA polymerase subunit E"